MKFMWRPHPGKKDQESKVGWTLTFIIVAGIAALGAGAYVVYKYRLRVCAAEQVLNMLLYIINPAKIVYQLEVSFVSVKIRHWRAYCQGRGLSLGEAWNHPCMMITKLMCFYFCSTNLYW